MRVVGSAVKFYDAMRLVAKIATATGDIVPLWECTTLGQLRAGEIFFLIDRPYQSCFHEVSVALDDAFLPENSVHWCIKADPLGSMDQAWDEIERTDGLGVLGKVVTLPSPLTALLGSQAPVEQAATP